MAGSFSFQLLIQARMPKTLLRTPLLPANMAGSAARSFRARAGTRGDNYEHHRMDRSGPGRRLPVRLGEPVNTAARPRDGRPPTGERRVMSTGVGITLIAVGAICGSPWRRVPRTA